MKFDKKVTYAFKGSLSLYFLLAVFIHYTFVSYEPWTYNHSLPQFYTMAPIIMQPIDEGSLLNYSLITSLVVNRQ